MTPGTQALVTLNLKKDIAKRVLRGATDKQLAGIRDELARAERGEW